MSKKNELNRTLTFRVSEKQYNEIINASKNANISHGEYIRKQLAGKRVYIRQEIVADVPQLKRLMAELGKTGSNINQIAHHLNSGGAMNAELYRYAQEALSAVFHMKYEVEKMGGEFRGYSQARLRKKQ